MRATSVRPRRILFTSLFAGALAVTCATSDARAQTASPTPSLPPPCLDFTSQEEAQAFFEAQGGPTSDPHGLDPDRDGRACAQPAATPSPPTTTATSAVTTTSPQTTTAVSGTGSRISTAALIGLGAAAVVFALFLFYLWRHRAAAPPPPIDPDGPQQLGW